MASNSIDPEVAFGPQKEWLRRDPLQDRPWMGPNAETLLPHNADANQVIEALELWGMPPEAWPQMDQEDLCYYILKKNRSPRHSCLSYRANVFHKKST